MNKYSDYLEVVDFPSEINPHSVKADSFRWQDTFPHPTFVELLKAVEKMLGRATSSAKKNIWIEGAYGTGKSRIAWTLKTLLECGGEELSAYFDEYSELQKETDLRDRLLGHKQGKIVTVYRYASGEINNIKDFIMAIYESTSKALKAAKVPFQGEDTLRGGILNWLSQPGSQNYLAELIALPENQMFGSLAGKSVETIIEQLKNPNNKVQNLVQELQKIGEKHGITTFSRTMDDLKNWLTEVITRNELKAIVFVWDEFSEFFRKNRNELGTFQSLIELANDQPFYLMIVTHDSLFSDSSQAEGKKISDRFIQKKIELPDSIAFDLINHVIQVKPIQQEEWNNLLNGCGDSVGLKDVMSTSTDTVAKAIWKESTKKGKDTLAGILPLHPMAALLLKYLSTHFASNQRSMFNFIKNKDSDELEAFQWFINTHSPDKEDILTIDYLWNFFYEKGVQDYGTAIGRSNLDTQIRAILDTYTLNQKVLDREESRVLKTILMMQAINEKLGNSLELFQPTEKNIKLAFDGVDPLDKRSDSIAKKLVRDGILFEKKLEKEKSCFAAAVAASDGVEIDKIKKKLLEKKTDELVQNGDFSSAITSKLTKSQQIRFEITPATSQNFTSKINELSNKSWTWKIPAVLTFARTDAERASLQNGIQKALQEEQYRKIVFIDASSCQLSEEKFDEWATFCAEMEYWKSKDRQNSQNYERQAAQILTDWKKDIANGICKISWFENPAGENCQNTSSLKEYLADIVLKRFPLSQDSAEMSEAMWSLCTSVPKKVVELGVQLKSGSIVQPKVIDWVKEKEEILGKFQRKITALVEERFQKDGRCEIGEIFDLLIENGFMPCNFYAYLTGFLLRDYAKDGYRSTDGESSSAMTPEKLAEITAENIKHHIQPVSRYKEKYIEVLTPEQTAFIRFAKNAWNISDCQSIEAAARRVCVKLKDLRFPIWCLKELNMPECDSFLGLLADFANSDNSQNKSSTAEIASQLGQMLNESPELEKKSISLLTPENARKGMNEFLKHFEGGRILELAGKLGVSDVLRDVQELFRHESLWLWNQEIGEDEIRKLLTNYRTMERSSSFLGSGINSLQKCFDGWREKSRTLKIPCVVLVNERPALKEFLRFLKEMLTEKKLAYENIGKFLEELETRSTEVTELFTNCRQIFQEIYANSLTHLDGEAVAALYTKLPGDSFLKEKSDAEVLVHEQAEKLRQEQASARLRQLWRELTGTESPGAWSDQHRTPILIMVPEKEREKAKRIFDALNRKNPDEQEIRDALEFLESSPAFLQTLKNQQQIDAAFSKYMLKKYSTLLKPSDVRTTLCNHVSTNCYDWFGSDVVNQNIEKMAQIKYSQDGCAKVQEKFASYNETQIRELLEWVVRNSVDAGIRILTEYEG